MKQLQQLLLLMLSLVLSLRHCMGAGSIAVPPLKAIRPLYVCKMQVSDLPTFTGQPTSEMLAANIGLSDSLAGMLQYWNMNDDAQQSQRKTTAEPATQESKDQTPIEVLTPPLPSPATAFNSEFVVPHSSISTVGVGAVSTAVVAEAAIARRHLMAAAGAAAVEDIITGEEAEAFAEATAAAAGGGAAEFTFPAVAKAAAAAAAAEVALPAVAAAAAAAAGCAGAAEVALPAVPAVDELLEYLALSRTPQSKSAAPVSPEDAEPSEAPLTSAAFKMPVFTIKQQQQQHSAEVQQKMAQEYSGSGGSTTVAAPAFSANETSSMLSEEQHEQQGHHQQQQQQHAELPQEQQHRQQQQHAEMQEQHHQQQQAEQQDAPLSPQRSLLQTATQPVTSVCNSGSPTDSASVFSGTSPGSPKFGLGGVGFNGIAMAKTQVIPPDPAIAVGPDSAIHIVNSLVAMYKVSSSGNPQQGVSTTPVKQTPLPDFFTLVASPCAGGYFSPAATYDKHVGRFIVTAVCGGDAYQVLLAVSTTSSALGSWILYSFAGEVTQGTPMVCGGYPASLHTQVTYNKDGVYLTFVQNCPDNQIQATGGVLYALPKWAVYKGATYFWVPVFTAWEVQRAAGLQSSEHYPPSAFLQLQPVQPQRPEDVQAEVAYFVNDNFVYDAYGTLQRTTFTLSALINTGSLWLYEGPGTASPTPLMVARIIPRGRDCMAVYGTRLSQPDGCGQLNAGGVRPPGFWDGGAALHSDKIYLAGRGPDTLDVNSSYQPTIYWAMLKPSFCVTGPCAPWFGLDWGWSNGWDWTAGSWASNSDRGRNPYADPRYCNQQFVYPSQSSKRRLQETGSSERSSRRRSQETGGNESISRPHLEGTVSSESSSSSSSVDGIEIRSQYKTAAEYAASEYSSVSGVDTEQRRTLAADGFVLVERNAVGVVKAASPSAATAAAGSTDVAAAMSAAAAAPSSSAPVMSRERLRAAVAAQQLHSDALQAVQTAADETLDKARTADTSSDTAGLAALRSQYRKAAKYAGSEVAGPRIVFRKPKNASISSNTSTNSSSSSIKNNTLQASGLLLLGAASFVWNGFMGWGLWYNSYYYDYYQYYLQYFYRQAAFPSQPIPPNVNPCKYYKHWPQETSVTFGAIVQNSGVLEFATTSKANPVGLAFPQVAVRGGQMLIVYSYAGPKQIPDGSGIKAYPGVAFSTIPIPKPSSMYNNNNNDNNVVNTSSTFNVVKPGAGCLSQYGSKYWGAYSGLDTHYPSYRVWSAVEYAASAPSDKDLPNAAIWISTL